MVSTADTGLERNCLVVQAAVERSVICIKLLDFNKTVTAGEPALYDCDLMDGLSDSD